MNPDAPRVLRYDVTGAPEFALSFGPSNGPQLIVIQPLFEEMNRCRALVAGLCRALAKKGIGCWLPDLPGTGESPRPLASVDWPDWHDAISTLIGHVTRNSAGTPRGLTVRGGALLADAIGAPCWQMSPVTGASLLTDLRRSARAGEGDMETPAGYQIPPVLADRLQVAEPHHANGDRIVRLTGDIKTADRHIEGPALWRRSEPAGDPTLVALLADDIAGWSVA